MQGKLKKSIGLYGPWISLFFAIVWGLLEELAFNKTTMEAILGGVIVLLAGTSFSQLLAFPVCVRELWETKARDMWDEMIGNSFANSDRLAVQHHDIIKSFLSEFPFQVGQMGYLGHIFTRTNVNFQFYTSWVDGIISSGQINQYETSNIFNPPDILADRQAKKVLQLLDDQNKFKCKNGKKRVQILSSENLRSWWNKWKPSSTLEKNLENFASSVVDEFVRFEKEYSKTFNLSYVFDAELSKYSWYLGEYFVINRRIVFRYDPITQVLEFILGDELVRLYSQLFDGDLSMLKPSDTDTEQMKIEILDYLKTHCRIG